MTQDDSITILEGDCRELMRGMADGGVDAIVVDPPYGIDYQSARRTDRAAWTPKILNDTTPCVEWLPDAFRVLRNGGGLVCFCAWKTQEAFREAITAAGLDVRSHVIWDRDSHGMGDLNGEFSPQHDVIWFAAKGAFKFPGKRPSSVFRQMRIAPQHLRHPNEKPVKLLADLIKAITKPGDLVLDPFAGSGSTLVAAMKSGRRAIGMELDPKYIPIIQRRVAEARTPLFDRIGAP